MALINLEGVAKEYTYEEYFDSIDEVWQILSDDRGACHAGEYGSITVYVDDAGFIRAYFSRHFVELSKKIFSHDEKDDLLAWLQIYMPCCNGWYVVNDFAPVPGEEILIAIASENRSMWTRGFYAEQGMVHALPSDQVPREYCLEVDADCVPAGWYEKSGINGKISPVENITHWRHAFELPIV